MPSGTRAETQAGTRAGTRAGRRVGLSAGRGLRGRWAAWRLFAAAGRGEPSALDGVAEIAGRQAHRLRERALDTLAGRLPVLLAAGDPGAREHAAGICRTASGPLLEALWGADTGPGTPLRSVLLDRDDVPPQPVVDTLWGECLRAPGTGPLDALVRWGRPASGGPEEPFSVIALGKDPDAVQDQDLAERLCDAAMAEPRLAWICVEHGFAPADPVKRSAFFLLTGQPGQYRALDPDGSLLALAYASRPDGERPRIREAMLAAGELDLVRVVAGDRRARLPDMSDGEARYLGEQLAGRGEWEELWSIVQDVPLPTGVELFRLFDRWAPRDQDSRRVFEMFRETPPAMVSIAVESMRWYWMTAALHATFDIKGGVRDMSFAPDGPLLAAVSEDGVAGILDLRTRRLVQRYEGFTAPPGRVLHTGNDTLIAGIGADGARPGRGLARCGADGVRTLHDAGPVTSLALTGEDGSFAAGTRDGRLLLGSPGGERVDARHVTALGLDAGDWPRALAAHPGSGRLAVLGRKLAVTFAMTGEATAAVEQPLTRAGFTDADSLVCADRHGTVTRLRGPRWRRTARTHYMGLAGLGALPGAGRAVALDREGGLHFLDAASLATLDTLRPPSPRSPAGLTVSPRGEFLAVRYPRGGVELFDLRVRELPDLVRRPVAELVPRHLGTVATALTHTGPLMTSATQATLRLLHACLQHRFRYDIEIGDAVELSAGQYDVSL